MHWQGCRDAQSISRSWKRIKLWPSNQSTGNAIVGLSIKDERKDDRLNIPKHRSIENSRFSWSNGSSWRNLKREKNEKNENDRNSESDTRKCRDRDSKLSSSSFGDRTQQMLELDCNFCSSFSFCLLFLWIWMPKTAKRRKMRRKRRRRKQTILIKLYLKACKRTKKMKRADFEKM